MSKNKIDHSARKHAYLSASGSDRWMNCTPSADMESEFPNETSIYAAEGTLAHEFAELNLRRDLGLITKKEYAIAVAPFVADPMYSEEMEEFVQVYVDYVIQQYTEAKRINPGAKILIEEKVDFSEFVDKGYGTTDTCITTDRVVEVIDYKHGMGVKVSAVENSQLKLYGTGALSVAEMLFDIDTVRLTIVQPRLQHISSWEISVEDLLAWANNEVKPKAALAHAGEGDAIPGSWCKWCRAKPKCKALAKHSLQVARDEFSEELSDPRLLKDEEILEKYKLVPEILEWAKSLQAYVSSQALAGKKWDGYKLVEGRANRKWVDEEKVIKILKNKRFKQAEYLSTPKLNGIPAIEKLLGKVDFPEILGKLVTKPAGAPSLVEADDNRPEYIVAGAKEDFSAEEN